VLQRFDGKLAIRPVPVLFAGLLRHWGQKGPGRDGHQAPLHLPPGAVAGRRRTASPSVSRRSIPSTRCARCARPWRWAARIDAIHEIFRFIWGEGRDPNDPAEWAELARRLDAPDLDARCNDAAVKSQLLQHGERALAAGVFGVPTLAIDGELFWGFDATGMALDYLADPALFTRGEYPRIDSSCRSAPPAKRPS
jgi:hypothetical protein